MLLLSLLFSLVVAFPQLASAAPGDEVSCLCEAQTCKPCEIETNLTFYTSKCGPNGSKVKSCKRPTCVPVENTNQCIAELEQNSKATGNIAQKAQKENAPVVALMPVGAVTNSQGKAKVIRANGKQELARNDLEVFEGDVIQTEGDGKVRVQLKDRNILSVASDSQVVIDTQQNDAASGKHKTMLTLMYGKLRAQVNKDNKYDSKDNSFNVRTKAAVAGVRGTDFVTTFYPGDKSWLSEVFTFEGKVEFGGDAQEQKVLVPGGQTASFAINSPPPGEVTDMQLKSYIQKGALSEVREMKEQEIEKLDFATDFKAQQTKPAEKPAASQAAVEAICSEPKGDFGQCSFTCEGSNPSGDSRCRTDLLNVRCVRRVCNANGQWAEATALPRSYGSFCQPERAIVRRDCSQH